MSPVTAIHQLWDFPLQKMGKEIERFDGNGATITIARRAFELHLVSKDRGLFAIGQIIVA